MTVRLVRAPRNVLRALCPWWGVCLVVVWGAMVAAAIALRHPGACLFKRVTGLPCPTCGTSRAVLALLRGDLLGAWLLNPLVMTVLAALLAMMSIRGVIGRRLECRLSKGERAAAWLIVAAAIIANWIYVIVVVG